MLVVVVVVCGAGAVLTVLGFVWACLRAPWGEETPRGLRVTQRKDVARDLGYTRRERVERCEGRRR